MCVCLCVDIYGLLLIFPDTGLHIACRRCVVSSNAIIIILLEVPPIFKAHEQHYLFENFYTHTKHRHNDSFATTNFIMILYLIFVLFAPVVPVLDVQCTDTHTFLIDIKTPFV